jgi:hypothetical protein
MAPPLRPPVTSSVTEASTTLAAKPHPGPSHLAARTEEAPTAGGTSQALPGQHALTAARGGEGEGRGVHQYYGEDMISDKEKMAKGGACVDYNLYFLLMLVIICSMERSLLFRKNSSGEKMCHL